MVRSVIFSPWYVQCLYINIHLRWCYWPQKCSFETISSLYHPWNVGFVAIIYIFQFFFKVHAKKKAQFLRCYQFYCYGIFPRIKKMGTRTFRRISDIVFIVLNCHIFVICSFSLIHWSNLYKYVCPVWLNIIIEIPLCIYKMFYTNHLTYVIDIVSTFLCLKWSKF